MIEAFTGPADSLWPVHADGVEQRHQFFGIGGLPGCDPGDQGPAASFGEQMQFGGQSSPGATDPLGCPRFDGAQPLLRAPAAFW